MQLDKEHAALRLKLECLESRKAEERSRTTSTEEPERISRKSSPLKAPPRSAMTTPPEGRHATKKRQKVTVIEQWVEIKVGTDGKTTTTLHPHNDVLIQQCQSMSPPPELVYRRLHFVSGIPEEYSWATNDSSIRTTGGMGVQRMTIETWLELIDQEKTKSEGHLLPTCNLPRPQDRGGCECLVCAGNRRALEHPARD